MCILYLPLQTGRCTHPNHMHCIAVRLAISAGVDFGSLSPDAVKSPRQDDACRVHKLPGHAITLKSTWSCRSFAPDETYRRSVQARQSRSRATHPLALPVEHGPRQTSPRKILPGPNPTQRISLLLKSLKSVPRHSGTKISNLQGSKPSQHWQFASRKPITRQCTLPTRRSR